MILTQLRSPVRSNKKQRETLRTLGLGKIGRSVERPNDPTVRGALKSVQHLVRVEE